MYVSYNITKTTETMIDLFATPVRTKRVRKNIIAYQYANGVINIDGQKYVMYCMTEAIKKFRKDFPYKS